MVNVKIRNQMLLMIIQGMSMSMRSFGTISRDVDLFLPSPM